MGKDKFPIVRDLDMLFLLRLLAFVFGHSRDYSKLAIFSIAQTGTSIRVFSEREVFSFLELTYVPPNERNVFENFMVESVAAPGGTCSAPA
jgi:hypothetical protein